MQVGNKEVFVKVSVAKSNYFRRQGNDVHTDATINHLQAILGGAVRIQGVYEDLTLEVGCWCLIRALICHIKVLIFFWGE